MRKTIQYIFEYLQRWWKTRTKISTKSLFTYSKGTFRVTLNSVIPKSAYFQQLMLISVGSIGGVLYTYVIRSITSSSAISSRMIMLLKADIYQCNQRTFNSFFCRNKNTCRAFNIYNCANNCFIIYIFLQLNRSNETQVTLQEVGYELNGKIKCEVTIDHIYKVISAEHNLSVICKYTYIMMG